MLKFDFIKYFAVAFLIFLTAMISACQQAKQEKSVLALDTVITLTAEGEKLRPAFESISRRLAGRAYAGLSPADARRLEAALSKMLAGFENPKPERTQP